MSKSIIDRLNKQAKRKSIEDADEVEWQAFKEGSAIIEYGIADELLSGELLDGSELVDGLDTDKESGSPAWITRSESEERQTSDLAEEIERRRLVLGDSYPFFVAGHRLEYRLSSDGIYEFCLAVSMSRKLSERPFNELPQAFEALATRVLVAWMGPGAKGWQTGFPGREKAGLPAALPELWHSIHKETGEWEWQPGKDVPEDAEDDQKDLGMDLLIWKEIGDGRTSALFLAGQCACGRDALKGNGKAADLDPNWLVEWFRVQGKVNFVPCLLLPRCLGSSSSELRARVGTLFFDRIRLVKAACQSDREVIDFEDKQRYKRLIDLVINEVN